MIPRASRPLRMIQLGVMFGLAACAGQVGPKTPPAERLTVDVAMFRWAALFEQAVTVSDIRAARKARERGLWIVEADDSEYAARVDAEWRKTLALGTTAPCEQEDIRVLVELRRGDGVTTGSFAVSVSCIQVRAEDRCYPLSDNLMRLVFERLNPAVRDETMGMCGAYRAGSDAPLFGPPVQR